MTIISNSFAPACRQLLPKYTISTLRSIDIVDNQKDYGCILKFTRFTRELLRSYVILYFLCDRLSRRLYFQIRHKDNDFRRIMGYLSRCFSAIRRNGACN